MDKVTRILEVFKEESKQKILDNQECQFVSNVLNSENRKSNIHCGFISANEVLKHSEKIWNDARVVRG